MRSIPILCCVLLAAAAHGKDSGGETSDPPIAKNVSPLGRAYIPPASVGAPRERTVGAATRSSRLPGPTLYSLVPEHTGQTLSEQPTLFWYLDSLPPDDASVYFTLTSELAIDPIAEIQLLKISEVGVQSVNLAERGIKLERGIEYEWTIAVVMDPDQRANDLVTAGWLVVVERPDGLESSARSYAAHGLWYDAIAAASDDFRADLLREVGLGSLVDASPRNAGGHSDPD